MWRQELIDEMLENKNDGNIEKMEGYMRNKFSFLGIQAKERRGISREYLKIGRREKAINWEFVELCWANKYREIQYIALDYLKSMEKYLEESDIERIEKLIREKSWWDSVDNLAGLVGYMVVEYPGLKEKMREWSKSDNIWLNRMSIIYQLRLKEDTDLELLSEFIDRNIGTDEFFINKAIGWALREYSKTDSEWVREFLEERKEKLSNLSKREASKYL